MPSRPWSVSLHGGHSGEFCEHATGSLRDLLRSAVEAGIRTFGITEHAPRTEARFLYPSERAAGYTVERLRREFEAYASVSGELQDEFRDRLQVLRGFEAEVVPSASYADTMLSLRDRYGFEFMVGSVHHVGDLPIDESPEAYREALTACGGLEPFLEAYYRSVEDMIQRLHPEVVGHLDLPRLYAPPGADLATDAIRKAAAGAVLAAGAHGCILDLNTAAWRKGLSDPYPAPWLVSMATEAGVPFCFGDDSHDPSHVGFGIERARRYLLRNGVRSVTSLQRTADGLQQVSIPLEGPDTGMEKRLASPPSPGRSV